MAASGVALESLESIEAALRAGVCLSWHRHSALQGVLYSWVEEYDRGAALHEPPEAPLANDMHLMGACVCVLLGRSPQLQGEYDLRKSLGPLYSKIIFTEKTLDAYDLEDLQKKVVWPTEMATCHNFSMHLISSTRRLSPFVIDYGHVGVRLPVLRSALGLAYLAHCSPAERDALLEFLRNQPPGFDGDLARKRDKVARALAITRRRGYAIRQGSLILGANYSDLLSKNATLAVPVLVGGRAVAAIAVTYIAAALSASDAVEKYLNTLMNAAAAITLKLEAQL